MTTLEFLLSRQLLMISSRALTARFSGETAVWRFEAMSRVTHQQDRRVCFFLALQLFFALFVEPQLDSRPSAEGRAEAVRSFRRGRYTFAPLNLRSPAWWLQAGRGLVNGTSQNGSKTFSLSGVGRLRCLHGAIHRLLGLGKVLNYPSFTNYVQN